MLNLADILKLAETEADPLGLTVVDTKLSQQGKQRVLEISICRKGGRISLDDCEELSRKLDRILDATDPPLIQGSFRLDVQSPGAERQLKSEREFKIFAGETVLVRTKQAVDPLGDKFTGILHSMDGSRLTIDKPSPVVQDTKRIKKARGNAVQVKPPAQITLDFSQVAEVRLYAEAEPAKIEQDQTENSRSEDN